MDNDKFQELVLEQLKQINNKLTSMEKGLVNIQTDYKGLKTSQISLEQIQHTMNEQVSSVKQGLDVIKTMQQEHGSVLTSIQYAAATQKSETDNLTHQSGALSSDVKSIAAKFKAFYSEINNRLDVISNKIENQEIHIQVTDQTRSSKRKDNK